MTSAAIFAIITGHGGDSQMCAEFCRFQHIFSINSGGPNNGGLFMAEFENAATLWGCSDSGPSMGASANQYGTWAYGRHGWCPGMAVSPLVWDVTAALSPPGGPRNILNYKALLNGATYSNNEGGANIIMATYLIIYGTH
jgi:hypothetical protein